MARTVRPFDHFLSETPRERRWGGGGDGWTPKVENVAGTRDCSRSMVRPRHFRWQLPSIRGANGERKRVTFYLLICGRVFVDRSRSNGRPTVVNSFFISFSSCGFFFGVCCDVDFLFLVAGARGPRRQGRESVSPVGRIWWSCRRVVAHQTPLRSERKARERDREREKVRKKERGRWEGSKSPKSGPHSAQKWGKMGSLALLGRRLRHCPGQEDNTHTHTRKRTHKKTPFRRRRPLRPRRGGFSFPHTERERDPAASVISQDAVVIR